LLLGPDIDHIINQPKKQQQQETPASQTPVPSVSSSSSGSTNHHYYLPPPMAPSESVSGPHTISITSSYHPMDSLEQLQSQQHQQQITHHFHFPPFGIHNMALKMRSQRGHNNTSTSKSGVNQKLSSWSPATDIRETKLGYHIEIETPGVSNKESLIIQWMSPRTLVVQGQIERPIVGRGEAPEGTEEWEQENDDWPNGVRHPQKVR